VDLTLDRPVAPPPAFDHGDVEHLRRAAERRRGGHNSPSPADRPVQRGGISALRIILAGVAGLILWVTMGRRTEPRYPPAAQPIISPAVEMTPELRIILAGGAGFVFWVTMGRPRGTNSPPHDRQAVAAVARPAPRGV
jgi:hypothetical protein